MSVGLYLLGGGWAALPGLLLLGFMLSFFRDPERSLPAGEGSVLSPADGKVTEVEEVEAPPFLFPAGGGGKALRVGIFLSVFDVHVNRSPLAGRVAHLEHADGKYLNALDPASSRENERQDLGLELEEGRGRILIRQIAGAIARRIVCEAQMGQGLARGQRYGMIKFGSRTELYFPADRVTVQVRPGDRVKGGESVIGVLS